jgi:cytochrome c oxidase assembly factor CtaG
MPLLGTNPLANPLANPGHTLGLAHLAAASSRTRGPWAYQLHPVAWLLVLALGLPYLAALHHLRRLSRRADRDTSAGKAWDRLYTPSTRQILSFASGLLAFTLAVSWPLADLAAHWSLTALLAQRLLIVLAAAPLMIVGLSDRMLSRITRPAPIDAAVEVLSRPAVAIVFFAVVSIGTLLTPAVAAQSSSALARYAIDLLLLAAGVVLWTPVIRRIPGAHHPGSAGTAAYLFVQSVLPNFPAVVYVLARHPFYPAFAGSHIAIGISPLSDQQLAGILAKVATLPVLWSAAWVALARGQRAAAKDVDDPPLTWEQVERSLERAGRRERRLEMRSRLRSSGQRHHSAIPRLPASRAPDSPDIPDDRHRLG